MLATISIAVHRVTACISIAVHRVRVLRILLVESIGIPVVDSYRRTAILLAPLLVYYYYRIAVVKGMPLP